VGHISHVVVNLCVNTLWRLRPRKHALPDTPNTLVPQDEKNEGNSEREYLRGLIRRFPYWMKGRALLANSSLEANDVATAYAEAQALLTLTPSNSHYHATALYELGRCFLRRNDPTSALAFLDQAHNLRPKDPSIQEEQSAALVLQGDKARALTILQAISPTDLSAEGKAALQWLVREQTNAPAAS
jgi:predicted Zn-dependent protease